MFWFRLSFPKSVAPQSFAVHADYIYMKLNAISDNFLNTILTHSAPPPLWMCTDISLNVCVSLKPKQLAFTSFSVRALFALKDVVCDIRSALTT